MRGEDNYSKYSFGISSSDGKDWRRMTKEEIAEDGIIPKGWRIFSAQNLRSQGFDSNSTVLFKFEGKEYYCGDNNHWNTNPEGLQKLAESNY